MCVNVHVCAHVCVFMHMCVWVHVCVIYICPYVSAGACTHAFVEARGRHLVSCFIAVCLSHLRQGILVNLEQCWQSEAHKTELWMHTQQPPLLHSTKGPNLVPHTWTSSVLTHWATFLTSGENFWLTKITNFRRPVKMPIDNQSTNPLQAPTHSSSLQKPCKLSSLNNKISSPEVF